MTGGRIHDSSVHDEGLIGRKKWKENHKKKGNSREEKKSNQLIWRERSNKVGQEKTIFTRHAIYYLQSESG